MQTEKFEPVAGLASRVLLCLLFVISGYGKIVAYAATQQYMEAAGVSGAFLPLVILTEVGGGLLVLIGFQTRLIAILLAGFTILTAVFFHSTAAQQTQLLKNLAIAGGFLALFVSGPGPLSVDALLGRKLKASPVGR